jgi:hypothetical protein
VTGLLVRALVGLALFGAPVGWLALGGAQSLHLGDSARTELSEPSPRHAERTEPASQDRAGAALAWAGEIGRRAGLIAGLIGVPLLASRVAARRRRRVARFRISVPRSDRPEPERVAAMVEAYHRICQRERGLGRLVFGQPHLALEWHALPDRAGSEVVFCVVCPPEIAPDLDAALSGCYPNARLGHEFAGPPAPWGRPVVWDRRMVRLRKGRSSVLRAAGVSGVREGVALPEAVMAVACARPAAVGIQLRLCPAPRLVERWVRSRLRGRERGLAGEPRRMLAGPGLAGPLERAELEGALELQHRGAFWSELWVLGDDPAGVHAVAGALQASAGEAPLVRRRPWLWLHRRRVADARPGPLSSLNLLFAPEVAALWRLPSPAAGLAAERSGVPRLPAPAEVARRRVDEGLLLDERGAVGLRPAEKPLGLALVGLQGTGKTSALIASVAEDAADPDCALIVLDPKSDLAARALSVIPAGRTVWHLDFARPEFGINPLLAEDDQDAVADAFIGALSDVHEDGAIRASSDRYLRMAVAGACALASDRGITPTLWLVHELLDPSADKLRAAVGEICRRDPALVHAAIFFERALPDQLQGARSQTTVKLDAPSNKLQRLLVATADQVLHHPAQLSIAEVIRRRQVLVVDGAMGSVGPDTSAKLLQIFLRLIFAALQAQQELPESERVRLALKIDEAHYVVNRTLARMMAVGRSAGLELTAAWQHSEQFTDPEVRAAIEQLLRHRITFAAGPEDARAAAVQAMSSYADVIRDDPASRELQRVLPDVIANLPQFHGICSLVCEERRVEPFVARTRPTALDSERIEHHLRAQRARRLGPERPHHPPALPNPLALVEAEEPRARPRPRVRPTLRLATVPPAVTVPRNDGPVVEAPSIANEGESADAPPVEASEPPEPSDATEPGQARPAMGEVVPEVEPPAAEPVAKNQAKPASAGTRAVRDARARAGAARPGADLGPVPQSYLELQIDDPTAITPDGVERLPESAIRPPRPDELEVLRLLYRARFLLGATLARAVGWDNERSARRALARLAAYGWVRRHRLRIAAGGRPRTIYSLTKEGFAAARTHVSRQGPYAPPDPGWSEPVISDPRRVIHDLHAGGYALALMAALGPAARVWHGERSKAARPQPPLRGRGDERRPILARELPLPRDRAVGGLALERFEQLEADAVLELDLPDGRMDLFIELDRTRRPGKNFPKFRRYDAFITAWSTALARYEPPRRRPAVLFVCEDEEQALAFLRTADTEMTGHLSVLRTPEEQWEYPGRAQMFFACERDAHHGELRCWRLPSLPPQVRARLGLARGPEPEQFELPRALATAGR